jgi:hypothetical protein
MGVRAKVILLIYFVIIPAVVMCVLLVKNSSFYEELNESFQQIAIILSAIFPGYIAFNILLKRHWHDLFKKTDRRDSTTRMD